VSRLKNVINNAMDVGIADQHKKKSKYREDDIIKTVQRTTPPYISLMWKDT